jgi:hypothetical protein
VVTGAIIGGIVGGGTVGDFLYVGAAQLLAGAKPWFYISPSGSDDTTTVQGAINDAYAAGGGVVYMRYGTFVITSTITLKPGVVLRGAGVNSILSYTGTGVALSASGASQPEVWNTRLSEFKLTTSTGTVGVDVKDIAHFTIDDVYVTGFSSSGIHLYGTAVTGSCINVYIHDCWILENTGHGILIDTVNNVNQIAIHHSRIQGNGKTGISMEASGSGISIVGCDIEGNGGGTPVAEIYLNGGNQGILIAGCWFESSAAIPAIIAADTVACGGITIHGNRISAATTITNAVVLGVSQFVTGVVINGNTFTGTYTNAISAAAVIGGHFGPNKCFNSIVHVANVGASTTGLRIDREVNRIALTYSASMTPDATLGDNQDITVTDTSAFTINAPTNSWDGAIMALTIRNTSGDAAGAATWNAVFKMSTWTNPANGQSRSITFKYNGTNWVQIAQTGVDVPN